MPTDFEELKRELLQSDEEFRQLATQHHDLDEQLHDLTARHYLSEPEQLEEVTLKKRKLHLKDQMENILRRHTSDGRAAARRAALTRPALTPVHEGQRRVRDAHRALAPVTFALSEHLVSMKIDRAGFPFIAGALVPAAALAADAPPRPGGVVRRCSADSSPISSAIPSAQVPQDADLVVSPADGRVMIAGPSDAPLGAAGRVEAVTIFLSPLDVHINRTPVGGRVDAHRLPAGQVPAGLQRRLERQRAERGLDRSRRADGRLPAGRRHAGAAHRLPRAEGTMLERGQRIGLMKFGSRMDVFLPTDAELLVSVGERVVGGETVLAMLRGAGARITCRCGGRARAIGQHRFRRGVFLLPSLFTVANLFCGYALRRLRDAPDFDTAALFIGIAMVLDTLDGFFARLTNSSSAFGVRARLARRRRVVRPGAGDPGVHVGPVAAEAARLGRRLPLRRPPPRCGSRASTSRRTTTASTDKRYFVGMPSPAAAAVIASTVYLYPGRACRTARRRCRRWRWCWSRRC